MAPVERSSVAKATPTTIWKTCFTPMKFESWDPDVEELKDVSGPCENGTTFTFHMKNGMKVPCVLSNVEENKSLTFSGKMLGGAMEFAGTVLLSPETPTTTKINYQFGLEGCLGAIFSTLNSKAVVEGTEHGLENMVSMSEDTQKAG